MNHGDPILFALSWLSPLVFALAFNLLLSCPSWLHKIALSLCALVGFVILNHWYLQSTPINPPPDEGAPGPGDGLYMLGYFLWLAISIFPFLVIVIIHLIFDWRRLRRV